MNENKKSFVVFTDYLDLMSDLTDEECGLLFRAILNYQKNGSLPAFEDRTMNTVFREIKSDLDRNAENAKDFSEQQRQNANARWHKSKMPPNAKNATVCQDMPTNATLCQKCDGINGNATECDLCLNENDNVNVNENGEGECEQEIVSVFQEIPRDGEKQPPSPVLQTQNYAPSPPNDYYKQVYSKLCEINEALRRNDRKPMLIDKTETAFMFGGFKLAGQYLTGKHSDDVLRSLDNFLKVANIPKGDLKKEYAPRDFEGFMRFCFDEFSQEDWDAKWYLKTGASLPQGAVKREVWACPFCDKTDNPVNQHVCLRCGTARGAKEKLQVAKFSAEDILRDIKSMQIAASG